MTERQSIDTDVLLGKIEVWDVQCSQTLHMAFACYKAVHIDDPIDDGVGDLDAFILNRIHFLGCGVGKILVVGLKVNCQMGVSKVTGCVSVSFEV